jgi:NAD-dependent SIR2 family protein deacetylase
MADTAIKTEEEKKEFIDDPETLDSKVTQLAEWVREAN